MPRKRLIATWPYFLLLEADFCEQNLPVPVSVKILGAIYCIHQFFDPVCSFVPLHAVKIGNTATIALEASFYTMFGAPKMSLFGGKALITLGTLNNPWKWSSIVLFKSLLCRLFMTHTSPNIFSFKLYNEFEDKASRKHLAPVFPRTTASWIRRFFYVGTSYIKT